MSTQTAMSPGTVWMREDHTLVVSVPITGAHEQPERVIRERLLAGVHNRWPDGDRDLLLVMLGTASTAPLTLIDPEEGHAEMEYGVVLR